MSASDSRTTDRPVLSDLPESGQRRQLILTGVVGTVGRCRDHTRQALHDWGWLPTEDPDQEARAEDILLVVSELVTNACQHTGGADQLVLYATGRTLRVEVYDGAATAPHLRLPYTPGRPGGHGLHTVALLASRWGHTPRTDHPGKAVWAEIDLPLT
ncbi:ATP-binding protein [Saccharothrix sp. ST-888]|uniref:ATP-binding protein n=1 Tax=Saccharothrix sp. ST-888 TaxID=1427391 RepID=UPI0005EC8ECA|nr:ATP-binding protein [Saccharothrix sp. ST-888]